MEAREAMERLNAEAGGRHIWLRTQANSPAQRPWFRETGLHASGGLAEGRVGAAQLKPVAHRLSGFHLLSSGYDNSRTRA